ncbi:MAG: ABC transporter ATP-binding protein [Deltaproteobacteria bacterium]|nr:MAG: ABC transporter ATP-binding protein [Deltaproteobacteria bacterium]
MIRLRALAKRYGSRRALAGIDLTLERREIVGVVGPDGAGKTTLLRALAGLLEVEAAEATVLGHDLRGDVTALKARVGYVPQAFSLHRDLTVEENLRFTARLHRVAEAEFRARAGELLARTGLAPFAGRPTGALSGGMKQKLALASALLPRPALLLLDEPTAGVDVMSRAEIWALLEREREAALVLIATSYLDEAAAADRLLYLERGRLIAAGTPAELRAAGPLQVYRAWGDARAIVRAARALPYVEGARATGRFARIEVRRGEAPGAARLLADLAALAGGAVSFTEEAPLDMESTLRALSGGV